MNQIHDSHFQPSGLTREQSENHCYSIRRAGRALSAITDLLMAGNHSTDKLHAVNAESVAALTELLSESILHNLGAIEPALIRQLHTH